MLNAVLALSIVALAMGAAVLTLSFLASSRLTSRGFRHLALLAVACMLMAAIDLVKEFDRAALSDLAWMLPVYTTAAAAGFGLFSWSALGLAFQLGRREASAIHLAARMALTALATLSGAWSELVPGTVPGLLTMVGMCVVQGYALAVLGVSLPRLQNANVRSLVRLVLVVSPPLILAIIAQSVTAAVGLAPPLLLDLPIAQLLYLLVMEALLLWYGLRYLFRVEPVQACILPDQFIARFSISPRECDIISMMVQGLSNRAIGEKLFISALTVKNHIYHIYQKTSVENKVQLINLINAAK